MVVAARWPLPALLVCAACVACKENETASPRTTIPEVVVRQVEVRDTPVEAEVTGTIRGGEDVEVRARVPGFLQSAQYQEGTYVRRGQVLFTIDRRTFAARVARERAAVSEALAMNRRAVIQVNRLRPLVAQNAVSKQDLDNAVAAQEASRASLAAARAELTESQLDLGYTSVRSPIDGIAGARLEDVGSFVGSPEPTVLTVVSSLDPVRFDFHISESEYLIFARASKARGKAPLTANAKLRLQLADGSTHPYQGKLTVVGRGVSLETGTLPMQASFPNPGGVLRPGQFGRLALLLTMRKNSIVIPQRAVQELQGTYSVFLVTKDNVVQVREVKLGDRVGSGWVVLEGLGPFDRIVVEGIQKVKAGQKVKPVPGPLTPADTAAEP